MTREEALRRVQEADFVLDDVALFLDTHPSFLPGCAAFFHGVSEGIHRGEGRL